MTSPIAVLVEDDPEQSEFSVDLLQEAGFHVYAFDSIAPALEYLRASTELIDLFVLDRRLPVNPGESATDELGDELLRQIRFDFTDSRIIVFTGYATIRHVQQSLAGGGQLPTQGSLPLDRVTVLEKSQSIEFREHVVEFRELLQALDNIEIAGSAAAGLSYRDQRKLRRLAFEYRSESISATSLGGGLSGARLWLCQLSRAEGHVATVVVKCMETPGVLGGLPELLPPRSAAATVATLSGLMGGGYLKVVQLAGRDAYPLMQLIGSSPTTAVQIAGPLWNELSAVASQRRVLTVAEICAPLIRWGDLTELLAERGVVVPQGTLTATVRIGMRHLDLHALNILVDGDHAVLIDCDTNAFAAGVLDPMTLLVSTLVHPASPIRGAAWPAPKEIATTFGSAEFGRNHPQEAWFKGVTSWLEGCRTSDREYWAIALAWAGRQFQYSDVKEDDAVVQRVLAIAIRAANALSAT